MSKPKYKIVNMIDYELNSAYSEGYEFLCFFNETFQSNTSHVHQNQYNNYNNNPSTIVIHLPEYNHSVHQVNKVLMQLSPTAEVLYGTPRTNQNSNS